MYQPSRPVEPVMIDGGTLMDVIIFPAGALNLKYWHPAPQVSLFVAWAFPANAKVPVVPSL